MTPRHDSDSPRIAIIGAGFSGIGMAMRLQAAGINSFEIFEAASEVGGTWFHNSYPGAACDIASHLYSFSFRRKHDWTKTYAGHEEILEYLKTCMREQDLYAKTRLNTAIETAAYDDDTSRWTLTTASGEQLEYDVVIFGCGQLNEPQRPNIPGLDEFQGEVFHSARWNHDYDLAGKRVAVIGNGASSAQFVPEIAKSVASLAVFQRTPSWIVPRRDFPYSETQKRRFRKIPGVESLHRLGIFWFNESGFLAFRPGQKWWGLIQGSDKAKEWADVALRHLERQVADPELRAKLTPHYGIGCKRVLLSNDWYPTLQRDNTELVTDRITKITADTIETEAGSTGHRLRLDEVYVVGQDHRLCWRRSRDCVGRRTAGAPGDHGRGLSQPLHALWAEHQPWPRHDHLHDRVPDPLHPYVHQTHAEGAPQDVGG